MTRLQMYLENVVFKSENRFHRFITKHIDTIDTICAKGIEILALVLAWYIIVKSPRIVDFVLEGYEDVFNSQALAELKEVVYYFGLLIKFILKVILFIPNMILKFLTWFFKDLIVSTIEFIKWIF